MTSLYPIVPGVTFKDTVGFPGYCVGDDGSVWTCLKKKGRSNKRGTDWVISDSWRPLKPSPGKGYLFVGLYDGHGSRRRISIHHLVLEAFVGPRPLPWTGPERTEGCHFPDPDRTNNRPGNLRWGTRKENGVDAVLQGRSQKGERNGFSKLKEEDIREMRRLYSEGLSPRKICKLFAVCKTNVENIVYGKTWLHVT